MYGDIQGCMDIYIGVYGNVWGCMVMYRCGYIVMYSTIIIGKFRFIIIIIYDVPTFFWSYSLKSYWFSNDRRLKFYFF